MTGHKLIFFVTGLPSTGVDKNKTYMQLGGRILLVLMCLTLLKPDFQFINLVQNVVVLVLVFFLALGFKVKI